VPSLPNKIDPAVREIQAEGKLASLMKGRRPVRSARWPVANKEFSMKILSSSEILASYGDARRYFREVLGIDPPTPLDMEQFEAECCTQILFRACREPSKPEETFATDIDDMRDHTTVDERTAVFEIYDDFRAEHDPNATEMTPELIQQLDELVKKKDLVALRGYGSRVLANYSLFTASRPSTSPTGSSDTST
jgi:hypothetical protein